MFETVKKKKQDIIKYLGTLGIPVQYIRNEELLLLAFVHKSYAADFKDTKHHNERLEFVWDGILWAVIAKLLFIHQPMMKESDMTLYKIALVREEILAEIGKEIHLDTMIFISKGEEKMHGRKKDSIISDALEALIGYLYLDLWYDVVEKFIYTYIYKKITTLQTHSIKSYKSMVQEIVQKSHKIIPEYRDFESIKDEKGNVIEYTAEMYINGEKVSEWVWTNKKKAEEAAAKAYYLKQKIS